MLKAHVRLVLSSPGHTQSLHSPIHVVCGLVLVVARYLLRHSATVMPQSLFTLSSTGTVERHRRVLYFPEQVLRCFNGTMGLTAADG